MIKRRVPSRTGVHGERNGQAKLTTTAVLEIRNPFTYKPTKEWAKQFNVSEDAILAVLNYSSWAHVKWRPNPPEN